MSPFLETAAAIGAQLTTEAVWHEDRCNWVGATSEADAWGRPAVTYVALGPDLYEGTSGVALFLAHLHAATGDGAARRTSVGAIRQALSRADHLPPALSTGLYAGRVGVAFAAARVGSLLGEAQLPGRAADLALAVEPAGDEFDLVSGRAGGIVGLLALARLVGDSAALVERAARLGDELLGLGRWAGERCSWRSRTFRTRADLTGLSHGAAGAGLALLELFRATGDGRYRAGAEGAFAYERRLFEPAVGNWPDLRKGPASFACSWCHGAPGIALSRLRAWPLLGDPVYEAEAAAGVETTRASVESMLAAGTANYSLCHGLAGNAEVLMTAAEVGPGRWGGLRGLARAVGRAGIAAHGAGAAWPCGTHEGQTPGLMLGLSGIGLFFLRLADPQVTPVTVLRPEDFGDR